MARSQQSVQLVLRAALTAAALVTSACGRPADHSPISQTKVTNGIVTNDFPAVVQLRFPGPQGPAACTGTFVNSTQVVTAAHCAHAVLSARVPASAMIFVKSTSFGPREVRALSMVYSPDYHVMPDTLSNHDIAVITFPAGSAPATTPLYRTQPRVGQRFTIVGYGLNNYEATNGGQHGTGGGVKRKGTNQIAAIDHGMIQFSGVPTATSPRVERGEDAASGSGDSGGPLLIDGELAATTSGGGVENTVNSEGEVVSVKISNYVDLHEASNWSFLESTLLGGLR